MSGFTNIELEAGEEMVFGPVTSTKTTSFSGGAGPSQGAISRTSGRTVGITNQRVIVEDLDTPGKSQIVANEQVQRVLIKHKQRGGRPTITIAQVQTASGATVKVGLPGINPRKETLLGETFSNAEIATDKDALGSKGAMIAVAVVAGLVILCCLVFFVGPMILGQ